MVLTRKQTSEQNNSQPNMSTTTTGIVSQNTNIAHTLKNVYNKLSLTPIGGFILLVVVTVFAHWSLANLYIYLCAPPSFYGLFTTVVSLGSPMCYFINIAQVELAKHYITIWGSAGVVIIAWMFAKISIKNNSS